MNIKPVEIIVSDRRRYYLLAIVVDRDDFLSGVAELRKRFGITGLFKRKNSASTSYDEALIIDKSWSGKGKIEDWESEIHKDILDFLRSLKLTTNFYCVVFFSVFAGLVKDFDLMHYFHGTAGNTYVYDPRSPYIVSPLNFAADKHKEDYTWEVLLDKYEVALVINPTHTKKQVVESYDAFKKNMKNTLKNWKIPDTVSNIERDRKWYWENKNGDSYDAIYLKEQKAGTSITSNGIAKAIQQYKNRLAVDS